MKTLLSTLTLAISLAALGGAATAHAQQSAQVQAPTQSALTREDVRNDLADWRKAGLDESQYAFHLEPFSAQQQHRYAEYLKLRHDRQARPREVAGH